MKDLAAALYDLRRRCFGRYLLDDPRPIAKSAPYTFFLPLEAEIAALRIGDLVQLVFRSVPPGRTWDAERMWVSITVISDRGLVGTLDSTPSDMPQLKPGAKVRFQRHHIIAAILQGEGRPQIVDDRRDYWDRCLVDDCVLSGDRPVGYVYREGPDLADADDKYPDSGWRIRGDLRDQTPEEIDARTASYVAVGAVLNRDDSWLHLIDEPIGAAFDRDFEAGTYVPAASD